MSHNVGQSVKVAVRWYAVSSEATDMIAVRHAADCAVVRWATCSARDDYRLSQLCSDNVESVDEDRLDVVPAAALALKLSIYKIFCHNITPLCPSYAIYGIIRVDIIERGHKFWAEVSA